jgi:N-acetylmuramic acid 6-phosphate etherase
MSDLDLGRLATESVREDLHDLDLRPTAELVQLALAEQQAVDAALAHAAEPLSEAIDAIAARMRTGGRLIYLGAGTSGRLAALDAAECPPTFGTSPDRVVALAAGGIPSLARAQEGSEDSGESAVEALQEIGLGPSDSVVGIAASGRTPYVASALVAAREAGALTVSIANNLDSEISALADIAIELPTGPELLAGSTRLKAGTAQKVVLGAISTLVVVKLGRTYGNLLVDLNAGNVKLRDRARRIVVSATGCDDDRARAALESAGNEVKVAVVMVLAGIGADEARQRLAGGAGVREVLGG